MGAVANSLGLLLLQLLWQCSLTIWPFNAVLQCRLEASSSLICSFLHMQEEKYKCTSRCTDAFCMGEEVAVASIQCALAVAALANDSVPVCTAPVCDNRDESYG